MFLAEGTSLENLEAFLLLQSCGCVILLACDLDAWWGKTTSVWQNYKPVCMWSRETAWISFWCEGSCGILSLLKQDVLIVFFFAMEHGSLKLSVSMLRWLDSKCTHERTNTQSYTFVNVSTVLQNEDHVNQQAADVASGAMEGTCSTSLIITCCLGYHTE